MRCALSISLVFHSISCPLDRCRFLHACNDPWFFSSTRCVGNSPHKTYSESRTTYSWYKKPKKRRLQIPIPMKERWFWLTEQRFFAHPSILIVTHTYSRFIINVLSYSMSKVIVFHFYKPLRHDKAVAWLVVYLPKCIWFGWLPTAYI